MLAKATEEGVDVDDVGCRIRIENDAIIQVSSNAVENFDNLSDNFYEPSRSSAIFLLHDEPLVELGSCAESGEGNGSS